MKVNASCSHGARNEYEAAERMTYFMMLTGGQSSLANNLKM